MRDYLKEKKNRIIEIFYNNTHNHIYLEKYRKYGNWYHCFKCIKCNHKIEIVFVEYNEYIYTDEFLINRVAYEYPRGQNDLFYICFMTKDFCFDKIKNDEINKKMLTCNEFIIKNIIE